MACSARARSASELALCLRRLSEGADKRYRVRSSAALTLADFEMMADALLFAHISKGEPT
jgi:hypothetical protein